MLFVLRNKTIWTLRLDKNRIYCAQFQFRVVRLLKFWYETLRGVSAILGVGILLLEEFLFLFIENHAVSC